MVELSEASSLSETIFFSNTSTEDRMKIGFIGLGIMGSRMAKHILNAGYELHIHNRTKDKAGELITSGAVWQDSPASVGRECDVVLTMLTNAEVVRSYASGNGGFLSSMNNQGKIWVDCSTVTPEASQFFLKSATERQVHFIEAPVAGTKGPAEAGELVFFTSGETSVIQKVQPLLDLMGKKTLAIGEIGQAATFKLIVNRFLAANMYYFSEAFKFGKNAGLGDELLLDVLPQLPVLPPFLLLIAEKIKAENQETNFPLKHMLKDIRQYNKADHRDSDVLSQAYLGFAEKD